MKNLTRMFIILLAMLFACLSCAQAAPESDLIEGLYASKCRASNADQETTRLGSLEEQDDVTGETYGFVTCQRKNLNTGTWDVIVQSNIAVGAGLDEKQALEKSSQAQAAGKDYVTFGLPFNPLGPMDKRLIEYRLYQKDGKPSEIELYVVMRDTDRNPKEAKMVKVAWPSIS